MRAGWGHWPSGPTARLTVRQRRLQAALQTAPAPMEPPTRTAMNPLPSTGTARPLACLCTPWRPNTPPCCEGAVKGLPPSWQALGVSPTGAPKPQVCTSDSGPAGPGELQPVAVLQPRVPPLGSAPWTHSCSGPEPARDSPRSPDTGRGSLTPHQENRAGSRIHKSRRSCSAAKSGPRRRPRPRPARAARGASPRAGGRASQPPSIQVRPELPLGPPTAPPPNYNSRRAPFRARRLQLPAALSAPSFCRMTGK